MITPEGKAWCALAEAKGIGPKTLWSIADYLTSQQKTASWLLQQPDAMEITLNGRSTRIDTSGMTISEPQEIECLEENEVSVLHPLHPDFPQRVRDLKDKFPLPAVLYTRGNTAIFNKPGVAIIGARHAGELALNTADKLASELVSHQVNITSGYAKGIDIAAHFAALREGGTTIIVLSEGINQFRPKGELGEFFTQEKILVISQFEPDAHWATHFAMTRNKLVCALSRAVIVIVSGPERDVDGRLSGTFDAGVTALEMGIPVFVVAPSYFDDKPEGNSQLITKGCTEWNPLDGAAPIITAILSENASESKNFIDKTEKPKTKQLELFDNEDSPNNRIHITLTRGRAKQR